MFTSFKRALDNTTKQIKRSGWLAWASVMVMTLALFITTIFLFLAFLSNLFLQSIENKSHIYVFFYAGTDEATIKDLNDRLLSMPQIYSVEYTDEEGATSEFKESQEIKDPQLANNIKSNVLPPSLGIRLKSISDANAIIEYLKTEKTNNKSVYDVRFSQETIDMIKSLFYWLRMGGGIIVGLLLIVIFFFTLLTVEFRTFSRAEEIGIMQLVGGSLWFIRAPFILEGVFYGAVGAFLSSSIIYIIYFFFFVVNRDTASVSFLMSIVGNLSWPHFTSVQYLGMFLGTVIFGGLIGAFNSFIAIRKYIS